jgi:hypothetical protein
MLVESISSCKRTLFTCCLRTELTDLLGIKDSEQLKIIHREWVGEILKNSFRESVSFLRQNKFTCQKIPVGLNFFIMRIF